MSDLDPAIERVNALARTARTNWLSLLTFSAFIGVTLLGVEDADFFVPSRQTELPIIGVSIPTERFFIFAPVLAAALYANLHFQLMKLWEALAPNRAPTYVRGKNFSDRIATSFIADMALALRRDQSLRVRPLRRVTAWLTGLLVFAAAPGVLAGFWWVSMAPKEEVLTIVWCGFSLAFTALVGINSFTHLWRHMRGKPSGPMRWKGFRHLGGWTIALAVAVFGWFRTEGTLDWYKETWTGWPQTAVNLIP